MATAYNPDSDLTIITTPTTVLNPASPSTPHEVPIVNPSSDTSTADTNTTIDPEEDPGIAEQQLNADIAAGQAGEAIETVSDEELAAIRLKADIATGEAGETIPTVDVNNLSSPISATGYQSGEPTFYTDDLPGATKTSVTGGVNKARSSAIAQSQSNYQSGYDWRVKLSLARNANYLYNTAKPGDILYPIQCTKGVVFPYTPAIQVSYKANYESSDVTHSNYKLFFYRNSAVDDINITCDFTAQDTSEANYVLAVIHFLRSVTKMFYGLDQTPSAGTPPPLCFLTGLGQYQFNNHPLLITSFQYSLPTDVDYIRAGSNTQYAGVNLGTAKAKPSTSGGGLGSILSRLSGSGLTQGAISSDPKFTTLSSAEASYVPTKMQIAIGCIPVVSRNNISNNFSVRDYATGALTKKGMW